LAVSAKTLEDWRAKGIRPPDWKKLGDPLAKTSPVRYRAGDLRDYIRGTTATLSTAAATAARQAAIDGLDEPAARPGRPRLSRHATALGFLSTATSEEAWPFVLAEPDGRPLDGVETIASSVDGPIEWLTLEDYAAAWRDAAARAHAREDRAELLAVVAPSTQNPKPQEMI